METTIKLKMVDTCNIQLGNHFNNIVNDYSTIAKAISPDKTIDKKSELHFEYIEGVQRKYYGLVEALSNNGLLSDNIKVVDLGCGLCTTLYNIMGQFKAYGIPANFYGVEYNEELLKTFVKYLSPLWGDNVPSFMVCDIMKCDVSDYDLILTYQPFKKLDDINNMYDKVFKEMKIGSIFYEHMINGASPVYKLEECKELFLNNVNKYNMEKRVLLFGGERQILFIKR
tara:strand:- start:1149 stop:1829 length:681 start_codon:yes stop_codon:yes gene_type:complete